MHDIGVWLQAPTSSQAIEVTRDSTSRSWLVSLATAMLRPPALPAGRPGGALPREHSGERVPAGMVCRGRLTTGPP